MILLLFGFIGLGFFIGLILLVLTAIGAKMQLKKEKQEAEIEAHKINDAMKQK